MNDAFSPLKVAIYALLNGNITDLASASIKVGEYIKASDGFPYVRFAGYSSSDESSDKSTDSQVVTFTIECVDRDRENRRGTKQVNSVAGQVINLLRVRTGSFPTVTGFTVVTCALIGDTSFTVDVGGAIEHRRELVFEYTLDE